MDSGLMGFGLLILIFVAYFAPALIASARGRDGTGMIAILNLLLGWTVIGWLVLLVIAFTGRTQRDRDLQEEQLRLMRTMVVQQSITSSQPVAPVVPVAPPQAAEPAPVGDNRTLAEIMGQPPSGDSRS